MQVEHGTAQEYNSISVLCQSAGRTLLRAVRSSDGQRVLLVAAERQSAARLQQLEREVTFLRQLQQSGTAYVRAITLGFPTLPVRCLSRAARISSRGGTTSIARPRRRMYVVCGTTVVHSIIETLSFLLPGIPGQLLAPATKLSLVDLVEGMQPSLFMPRRCG